MKKEHKVLIGVGLILLAGLFYWLQVRPSSIKKSCHRESINQASLENSFESATERYNALYERCLNRNGL